MRIKVEASAIQTPNDQFATILHIEDKLTIKVELCGNGSVHSIGIKDIVGVQLTDDATSPERRFILRVKTTGCEQMIYGSNVPPGPITSLAKGN